AGARSDPRLRALPAPAAGRARVDDVIDVRAWLLWAAAGMLGVLSPRNPLYVARLLLVALAVDRATARLRVRRLPFRPLPLVIFATAAGAAFNALTAHFGETV